MPPDRIVSASTINLVITTRAIKLIIARGADDSVVQIRHGDGHGLVGRVRAIRSRHRDGVDVVAIGISRVLIVRRIHEAHLTGAGVDREQSRIRTAERIAHRISIRVARRSRIDDPRHVLRNTCRPTRGEGWRGIILVRHGDGHGLVGRVRAIRSRHRDGVDVVAIGISRVLIVRRIHEAHLTGAGVDREQSRIRTAERIAHRISIRVARRSRIDDPRHVLRNTCRPTRGEGWRGIDNCWSIRTGTASTASGGGCTA